MISASKSANGPEIILTLSPALTSSSTFSTCEDDLCKIRLISLSFTFVPMLLFNVVKTGFNFVVSAYDTIADLFHFSHEEREMVQYISDQQRREEEKEQAQSAPGPKPVF